MPIYTRLLRYMFRFWAPFLVGVIGTILGSGTDAGFTWFLKPLINKGFIGKDPAFIHYLPIIILAAFLIRGVSSFLADYFLARVGRQVVMCFRRDLFSKFLFLPTAHYDKTTTGEMLSLMLYNVEQIAKSSTTTLIIIVREVCLVIGLCYVMFSNSWQLTLIFLLTVPLIALVVLWTSRRMRGLSKNVQGTMADITHFAEEAISGHREIKSFSGQPYEMQKFSDAVYRNFQREMKVVVTDSLATSSVQIIAACAIAVILYMATSATRYGISAGAFVSMIAAMLAILKPMKTLTTVNSTIQKGVAAAEEIFEILDTASENNTGTQQIQASGQISIKHLHFSYPHLPHKKVLQDISFDVSPGQMVALIGRSGAGKSTLAALLPRFYNPLSGDILLDGISIQEIELSNLREQMALVSQQVVLFNDTIANNIAYGLFEKASEQDIVQAAIAAHAWPFIEALPEGLKTRIGEDGVLLSGGQRQRIAIARAILKNTPILILDEATSALDTESERHIQAALDELMKGRTSLVIAHRLSTIEHADLILVMEEGRIVEAGQHESLLAKGGAYAHFYQLQFGTKIS